MEHDAGGGVVRPVHELGHDLVIERLCLGFGFRLDMNLRNRSSSNVYASKQRLVTMRD